MNCGSVGFLMNEFAIERLVERLAAANATRIAPLEMRVTGVDGERHEALALNEVSLFRTTYQAVKVEIVVDGRTQMEELICDGNGNVGVVLCVPHKVFSDLDTRGLHCIPEA